MRSKLARDRATDDGFCRRRHCRACRRGPVLVASASGALRPQAPAQRPAAPATAHAAPSAAAAASPTGRRPRSHTCRWRSATVHAVLRSASTATPRPPRRDPRSRPTRREHDGLGDYEFFRPPRRSRPARLHADDPARPLRPSPQARSCAHDASRLPSRDHRLQEALARLNYLPYSLHGFIGASSVAPLTRAAAARARRSSPRILRANVRAATAADDGHRRSDTTGAMEVFRRITGLPLGTTPTQQLWTELLADERWPRRTRVPTPG